MPVMAERRETHTCAGGAREASMVEAGDNWADLLTYASRGGVVYLTQRGRRRAAIVSGEQGQAIAAAVGRTTTEVVGASRARGGLADLVDRVLMGDAVVEVTRRYQTSVWVVPLRMLDAARDTTHCHAA